MIKKSYDSPRIFKVDLNAQQAILSTCKVGQGAQLSNRTRSGGYCATNCRRARTTRAAGYDSGNRPS